MIQMSRDKFDLHLILERRQNMKEGKGIRTAGETVKSMDQNS